MDFQSSIADLDSVTKEIKISIPAQAFKSAFDTEIGKISRQAQLKGFRPGKAPRDLVLRSYGDKVRVDVINQLVSESLRDTVEKNELPIVGEPEIAIGSAELEKDLQFTAKVALYPKPEIKEYASFEVSVPKKAVADKDVADVITRMREGKATPVKLTSRTEAQLGDVLDLQLGVDVPGQKSQRAEPVTIELGKGNLPVAVENGLLGMAVGSSRDIAYDVPSDDPNEQLRGKSITYHATLTNLSEKIVPDLNEEFVASLNMKAHTVAELEADVRKNLDTETERNVKALVQMAILDELLKRNEFEVPQALIDEEIRDFLVQRGYLDPRTMPPNFTVIPFRQALGEAAAKRVKTTVLVDRVGEQEKIVASQEDLEKAFEEMAARSQIATQEIKNYFMGSDKIEGFKVEQARNKVLDFLVERAKVTYTVPEAEKPESENKN